jgi:hypothetical protein
MGNIISSCCKKKDDDDILDKEINNRSDNIISNIGDKYCQGTVKIEINDTTSSNDNQNLINSSGIYKNQFDADPMKKYKIVSELSENLKSVCLIDNPLAVRLMKIIPKKIKTKNKNKIYELIDIERPSCNYIILESLLHIKENNENNKFIHVINLKNEDDIIIGRSNEVDIKINDISVSRFHAKLKFNFEKKSLEIIYL